MLAYFNVEFKRNVKSPSFMKAVLIGFVIIIIHQIIISQHVPSKNENVFLFALGFENTYMLRDIYYLLLPIIVALAGSDLFGEDNRSQSYHIIRSRVSKSNYFTVKIILSFLLGGLAFVLPLFVDMTILSMMYPTKSIDIFSEISPVGYDDALGSVFVASPIVYWLIFLLIAFMFGGIFSWIGFLTSLFTINKYLVLLIPFFVYYLAWIILSLLGFPEWSPFGFLEPLQGYITVSMTVIGVEMVASIILCSLLMIGRTRNEFI